MKPATSTTADDEDWSAKYDSMYRVWWSAIELWYNCTDQYPYATELWVQSIQDYYYYDDDDDDDDSDPTETRRMNRDDSGNNENRNGAVLWRQSHHECYGIDQLEVAWRTIWNAAVVQRQQSSLPPPPRGVTCQREECMYEWDMSMIQLLLFVAGSCLDAQQISVARQCLLYAIRQLLPQIAVVESILPPNESDSVLANTTQTMDQPSCRVYKMNCLYKLLAAVLQEYIASYEEEQELEQRGKPASSSSSSPPHWMVARRVAALRMSLPTHIDIHHNHVRRTQTPHPPLHSSSPQCFWNPRNVYQRPPCYIHYPTFLQADSNTEIELNGKNTDVSHVLSSAVLPREYHPVWCHQLEQHITIIQKEFEELLMQHQQVPLHYNSIASTQNDRHTTTTNNKNDQSRIPTHWPKVGDGAHRNGTGTHDSTVVQHGGDWREMVLFSAHNGTTTSTGTSTDDIAPQTKRLIRQYCASEVLSLVDTGIGEVIFSVLAPHTRILPHTASHNVRYTAHLPLCIPQSTATTAIHATTKRRCDPKTSGDSTADENDTTPNCYIRIGEEICTWQVGKMLVFDDSYEHEVVNSTNEIRGVLLLRFWHPCLTHSKMDQDRAIHLVQTAQQEDRCKRYNPPIPPSPSTILGCYNMDEIAPPMTTTSSTNHYNQVRVAITARGMEQTYCPSCQWTGYESIRCCTVQPPRFSCVCGQPI
jgi:Aspartyl/Asparaginyl beta-hydroxylase